MSLPPGTLLIYATEALSSPSYTIKKAPQGEATQVCWVTPWHHDKAPMTKKVLKQPRIYPGGFRNWITHLSLQDGVQHSRIYCPTQGQAQQSSLPRGNNIPG